VLTQNNIAPATWPAGLFEISTSIGASGLDHAPVDNIVTEGDRRQFPGSVTELLVAHDLRQE
jgi:hypothetical protein